MELAYYFGLDDKKALDQLMDEEFFKRLGPTIRECGALGIDKDGFCMYIKARDDLVEEAKKILKEKSIAKPVTGDEGDAMIKAFRDEAEAAEAGMGALFG